MLVTRQVLARIAFYAYKALRTRHLLSSRSSQRVSSFPPIVDLSGREGRSLAKQHTGHPASRERRPPESGRALRGVSGNSQVSPIDLARIQAAVREILLAVGEDPAREGLLGTPERVARMYAELFAGMCKDPREVLRQKFTQKYDEMVLEKDIGFESMCEHHLMPFLGKAHIAYLPNGKIVGLSKLARVVEILSRRPQVQERMTEELADLLMEELQPRGVGVILEAAHTCMTIRGIRKSTSICTTSAMRGAFKDNQSTRAELMALIYGSR
jgi:GTP cyclohydrolase I